MMFKTLSALSFLGIALAYTPAPGGTASCWTFPPVSTSSTPSPSPIPDAQPVWAQCGGVNYAGPTVCQPGLYCHEYNEFGQYYDDSAHVYGIEQLDCHAIFIPSPGFNGDSDVLDGDDNPDGYPNIRPSYPRRRAIGELSSSCAIDLHAPHSDHRRPNSTSNAAAKATRAKLCASPVHIAMSITSGTRSAFRSWQRQQARLNRRRQPSFARNSSFRERNYHISTYK
ncbi:hypothetical protein PC9H_006960 [Pleurotus ostreatus]|uniref:CBM1 domain-containing protein n=1 Tax=Pleurotus ostreatus TaxID=5322 RepID=A0A8H7DUL1_PLEOS|nr:uncharacterized protein PC9H_006960 [Pleurotus ostreatus]KAF7431239.1 hypothetical protein PC9H_006960 [Pleurotus ostreatus]